MPDSAPVPLPAAQFAEILERTQVRLVGFARGLLGNGEDARDVVQDVYVEAWRQAQRCGAPFRREADPAEIDRWLYAVVYHRAISHLRHRRVIAWETLQPETTSEGAGQGGTAAFEDRVVEGAALQAALASLEPEDSACLLLNLVQGYSAGEIARTLDITPDAARKRTSRALQRLRAAYAEQNPQSAGTPDPPAFKTQPAPGGVVRKRGEL